MHCWGKCWVVPSACSPQASFPAQVSKGFWLAVWVPWWVQRDSGFPSPWLWGFFSTVLLPTRRRWGACLSVLPMSPSGPITHNFHTPWWPTLNSFAKGLWSLAHTTLSFPHYCSFSFAFLFFSCMPCSLTIHPHVQIFPKYSQQRFPLAAHACCLLLPLSVSATMGWFELCAWQCVCADSRDLAGKGQPKRHRGGDIFPRDAGNREVRVGRFHPLGSWSIHLSVGPGFTLFCLLWCQTHTC